jgi:hypothetical protein
MKIRDRKTKQLVDATAADIALILNLSNHALQASGMVPTGGI